jgi:hypothetical protein
MTPLNLTMSPETYQRGYRRGNEVFRPAKVVVNDPSQAEAGSSDDDDLVPQMPTVWAFLNIGLGSCMVEHHRRDFRRIIQLCGIYIDIVPGRKPIPQR